MCHNYHALPESDDPAAVLRDFTRLWRARRLELASFARFKMYLNVLGAGSLPLGSFDPSLEAFGRRRAAKVS